MERPTCLQQRDVTPPQVFISSTFEPLLKEIRDLLRSELEDANYLPVMSELGHFAYSHGRSPVYEDTIQAVKTSQLYVLVIGRTYGTRKPDDGLSVTEQEYRTARDSNLPILVYVHSRVWGGYEAFRSKAIAAGQYTHWVDDEEVFQFIDRVAQEDGCRCLPFSHAREVIADFHCQVANLLGGYLRFELKAAAWLWSEWRTRRVEASAGTIWIVTPDFYWDYHDETFRAIVFDNVVKRGASYWYLYRDSPDNQHRVDDMVRDYSTEIGDQWPDRVHFAAVPSEQFVWCTEQILFDAFNPRRECGIIVDIMDERNKYNKYNVQLGRAKLAAFREQFTRLWKLYGTGDPVPPSTAPGTAP